MCVLLMNEGRWSSDSDLQSEVGLSRIPDLNVKRNQSRMLEEEEEIHRGDEEEEEEGEEEEGSKLEDEEEEELDSTSGACSPELDGQIRESSSLSSSPTVCEGAPSPEEILLGSVFPSDDLSPSITKSLRTLEVSGDDTMLPHRLHQIAESLMQNEDYARAIQFLQLERLYHERVLSNIAALQDTWESRWRCRVNAVPVSNLESEHLDKLRHICRTHRQPTWSVPTCKPVTKVLGVNGESCVGDGVVSEPPCSNTDLVMSEQDDDAVSPSKSDTARTDHQEEPTHPCDSSPAPPTTSVQAPPPVDMTDSSPEDEGEKEMDIKEAEPGGDTKEAEPGLSIKEAEPEESDPDNKEVMEEGGEPGNPGKVLEKELQEVEEEDIEEAIEALELEEELRRSEVAKLDDLAKRIKVEEISPALGLVSILKRRGSAEAAQDPPSDKTVSKRRVRFHVPEDGLEPDEVGGDSWLLLLLLCLVTVVISVGGTALYCAFGDAHSSVCTDFSHNVDFYVGKVQRSVDKLTHFFSSGS